MPSFTAVQAQFQNQPNNITFYLQLQNVSFRQWSYTVTPDNLKNSVDWQTLLKNAGMQSKTDDAGGGYIMTCSSDNASFTFTPSASQNVFDSLTYLQFDNNPNEINGAALFCGIEGMAINTPGVYPNDNIFPSGADWLGLTAASGGVITPGTDGIYNTNSAELICGIAEMGAVLTPGADEGGNVINNSATLLKGTKERDAVLVPGYDAGEEPPGTFDKLSTWIGSMDISDEIKCRKLTVLDGADIGGVINLKPTTVPEDDQQEREKSSVEVTGGINAETLVISKTVEIADKLTCNSGIDVTKGDVDIQDGELKIKGCEVQGEHGKLSVQGNLDVNG
ncbi:MAG: hypothetical protein LBC04_02250, partial [Holosporaceae bacterium]|nr:hypothetical protein [Holosporaceae bacterium]